MEEQEVVNTVKITKLVNGETIIAAVQHMNGFIVVTEPLQMLVMPNPTGGLRQVLSPWIEASDAVDYAIPEMHVLTVAAARPEVVEVYENFLASKKFSEAEQEELEENPLEELNNLLDLLDTSNTIH